jgi:hypothetical protein
MGTWGITAFEDDTALDFYDTFCASQQSIQSLEKCLDIVLATQYNMDSLLMEGFTQPVAALISAEIIAAALGKPSGQYPGSEYHTEMGTTAIDLESIRKQLSPDIKDKAAKAITRIKDAKEIHLTVLWQESESFDEWKAYMDNLLLRLE